MSGLSKILPRNKTARACEAVSFVLHFGKLGADVFGIGQGGKHGRGFDPCGFVRLLGLEADGGENVVEKRAESSPLKSVPCRLSSVDGQIADHHDFRRPDGYVKIGADCLNARLFCFAGVSAMVLRAASGTRTPVWPFAQWQWRQCVPDGRLRIKCARLARYRQQWFWGRTGAAAARARHG